MIFQNTTPTSLFSQFQFPPSIDFDCSRRFDRQSKKKRRRRKENHWSDGSSILQPPPLLADIPIKFGISPRQRRDATHPSVAIHPYRFRNDSKFVTGSIFGRRKQPAGWLQDVCRVYIFRLPPAALFVARSVIIDAVHWITQLTVYY